MGSDGERRDDQITEVMTPVAAPTRRPTQLADFRANLSQFDGPLLAEVARQAAGLAQVAAPPPDATIFTDDRAPVEQVVHALVLKQMLGDGQ